MAEDRTLGGWPSWGRRGLAQPCGADTPRSVHTAALVHFKHVVSVSLSFLDLWGSLLSWPILSPGVAGTATPRPHRSDSRSCLQGPGSGYTSDSEEGPCGHAAWGRRGARAECAHHLLSRVSPKGHA